MKNKLMDRTNAQTSKQTHRHRDRQTYIHTDRQPEDIQTCKQTHWHTDRQTDIHTHTHTAGFCLAQSTDRSNTQTTSSVRTVKD